MEISNYHLTMKKLPLDIRPRERLFRYGASGLSDSELLAILLGTGTKRETALQLGQRILSKFKNLRNLVSTSPEELAEINGIGKAKSSQIVAAVELGRRMNTISNEKGNFITNPKDVVDLFMAEMRYLDRECFKAALLNTKNKVLKIVEVSTGNLNSSIVHPREVYKFAIKCSAASVIVVHNHPSGDSSPSKEDVVTTQRLSEAGKLLGIELLDHVIIGDGEYTSLKEKNLV
ncbi:DNA repair protein RadC [Candidatus Oleimmundimicrobium sp.]|uniref:RadC family protein n=1 Tax=Candidatus Oleimmundimicrobium sp. TaxID=3060597 RepID=UPI0027266A43|nr:DNA repair protein RadC [Candidatus Oleimmundimicrobium sp.]MDO8886137.1 DNA repair protein RadC [Candidatus Oleimmundimicrobium sp.]